MRNRQIIEYLIYPKFFNSISILYKGSYCVSFKIYHVSRKKTITYAYPFVSSVFNLQKMDESNSASLHTDGNFSYETELQYALYQQETKPLHSFCVFRLEYEMGKEYETFLSCKLLRKISSGRKDEGQLCIKKQTEIKYETIDTQIFKFKSRIVSVYDKIFFRASQFFSSVDLYISTFNYGYKCFVSKLQISNILSGDNLLKNRPMDILKSRQQSPDTNQKKRTEKELFKNRQVKDLAVLIQTNYYQLLSMLLQYDKWLKEIYCLRMSMKVENQRQLLEQQQNLNYVRMTKTVTEANLQLHYQTNRIEDTLICILEEKQMIRRNIRNLRVIFSKLLVQQSDNQFRDFIQKNNAKKEALLMKNFVKYIQQREQGFQDDNEARNEAVLNYSKSLDLINDKVLRMPILLVKNSDRKEKEWPKVNSLTIFVHGYQGNSFDFQKARNYLKKNNKRTQILIVESISNEMNSSIGDLGFAAAQQITNYVQNSIIKFQAINFIGFSLGGVIARSAFKHLERYRHLFKLFITFSSPHLGISESDNSLVNIGVWYLIKVDKVINLKQLNFQSVKMQESLLMKLSNSQYLTYFKKVVVVGSKHDGFVPLYSTVLEQTMCDRQIKVLCENMKRNISRLQRVQVLFNVQNSGTLDKLTGRKGHIEFLDNDYFLEMFFKLYACQL